MYENKNDDDDTKLVFVDLAGFQDNNGPMIDLINCLMDRLIFSKVNSVKFIMAVTHDSM